MTPASPPSNQDLMIALKGAKNAEAMYESMNTKNIALYQSNAAAGHPSAPPPIYTFHSDVYISLTMQQSANPGAELDWSGVVTVSTYVPPATPPAEGSHLPTSVVGPVGPDWPGLYYLSPDSRSISAGSTTVIDGVTWTKEQYSENIAGPQYAWRAAQ